MIYFLADQSKITIKLKNNLVLPLQTTVSETAAYYSCVAPGNCSVMFRSAANGDLQAARRAHTLRVVYLSLRPLGKGDGAEREWPEKSHRKRLS